LALRDRFSEPDAIGFADADGDCHVCSNSHGYSYGYRGRRGYSTGDLTNMDRQLQGTR